MTELEELQKRAGMLPSQEVHPSIRRKRTILEDAIKACTGDRQLNYGSPEDNFRRISELWNAYLGMRVQDKKPYQLEPWEVAIFNILMKIARIANQPAHRDSWLDIAGYAACGADITEAK